MRKIGIGILVLVTSVLAFKFLSWNFWKLQDTTDTAERIFKAPPAVNLTLSKGGAELFQWSFPHHPHHYYIINRFDISPYLRDHSLRVVIGNQPLSAYLIFRFTHFNVLCAGDSYFVFFKNDCPIEEFIRWKDSMSLVIGSLFKLALNSVEANEKGNIEIIYRFLLRPGIELSYGSGRLSRSIPVVFTKGLWYEAVIDYRVIGRAKPLFQIEAEPFSPDSPVFRGILERSPVDDRPRRAFVIFKPGTDLHSLMFHLFLRGARGSRDSRHIKDKDSRIFFERIIFYRYLEAPPGLSELTASGITVTYRDFLNKIRKEFIEVFPVRR